MSTTPSYTELQQMHAEAQRLRDEAAELNARADVKLRDGNYKLGQAEHRHKEIAAMERSIAEREQHLKELGEPELVAREQAVEAKLKEAQELMASVDKEKHAAAVNLNQLIEHDKREFAAMGIEY
jgi:hypothetical protein